MIADTRGIVVCCSDMLCDLTGVNEAFDFGFSWEETEGEPISLHEWRSDKEGDEREIKECSYCGKVPLRWA